MELRSGQESIHRDFNNLSRSQPIEGPSKLSSASIATTVTDRRRNHGATSLNPQQQTLDPHLPHLPHPQHSNHVPQQQQYQLHQQGQGSSNPDPDLVPPPPPPAFDAPPIITSTTTTCASDSKLPPPQPPAATATTTTTAVASVQYRECLKNHAASTGGHVVDGCGEFMPGGRENTPEGLRCAACDCHRNFHRREVQGEEHNTPQIQSGNPNSNYPCISHRITTNHPHHHLHHLPSPSHQHQNRNAGSGRYSYGSIPPPVMMAFHGGTAAESSSEGLNVFRYNYNNNNNAGGGTTTTPPNQAAKKRHRTKFSQGQKERMQEFAERLGWKLQKQDDQVVDRFCEEVGVKRQVFKVWIHNNKTAIKKNRQH